jgi:hypothetical protein
MQLKEFQKMEDNLLLILIDNDFFTDISFEIFETLFFSLISLLEKIQINNFDNFFEIC